MKLKRFVIFSILFSGMIITSKHIYAASLNTNRVVLVEEFTGTWCGWCPYASELLEELKEENTNICILAYHMYDEMQTEEGTQYFSIVLGGSNLTRSLPKSINNLSLVFPCAVVDRSYFPNAHEHNPEGLTILQENYESCIAQQLLIQPTFSIDLQCEYHTSSRTVEVEVTLLALQDLSGKYRISLILSESELNYEQKLYDEQENEEWLDPFYHKHVVRDMVNGVTGELLEKTSFSEGENLLKNFSFTLDENFVVENCQLVVVVNKDQKDEIGPVQQAAEITIVKSTEANLTNNDNIPNTVQLMQNYPNPFNAVTNIQFQLGETGFVNLDIFDITGRKVASLIQKKMPQGYHIIRWNSQNHPCGLYFYKLHVNNKLSEIKKMILQK